MKLGLGRLPKMSEAICLKIFHIGREGYNALCWGALLEELVYQWNFVGTPSAFCFFEPTSTSLFVWVGKNLMSKANLQGSEMVWQFKC